MGPGETDLGGRNRSFRTTIWSDIVAAAGGDRPGTRDALDRLIRAYWKPVYAYIGSAWNLHGEEAKDCTQAFFARLLEKDLWSLIRKERGSFRSYLKTSLRNFLINHKRDETLHHPDARAFRLEISPGTMASFEPVAPGESPEDLYDRAWFKGLMEDSVAELREFLVSQKKTRYFDVFQAYCIDSRRTLREGDGPDDPSYRDIAERLGIHHSNVRNYLAYCRKEIRRIVRERIREYVTSEDEADRELGEAFRE